MKDKLINRRDFIKYAGTGMAVIFVGSKMSWFGDGVAHAAEASFAFTITDTIKEMVTHNEVNKAESYFWIYKEAGLPADCPGPIIYAHTGDTVNLTITNALDEPHNMAIPELGFDSGSIAPGATVSASFTASKAGTYLYHDTLNAPVNRVMGLHGCLIVMPAVKSGTKWTPYDAGDATSQVQQLFNDLGSTDHWPGLAWEERDPEILGDGVGNELARGAKTAAFRQGVWLLHQASPNLFAEVGDYTPGLDYPADVFVRRFRQDRFSHNSHDLSVASDIPQYFTVGGQSGHFAHNNPVSTPMARVGEPYVLRVLNAGLMTHSMHIHCNHFFILSVDGVVQGAPVGAGEHNATLLKSGPVWVDTWTANPWGENSHKYDLLLPYMRPPDIGTVAGIGPIHANVTMPGGEIKLADTPLTTVNGGPTWPPYEEFDRAYGITIPVRQSPLCYPAHDHSEPSQTAQGGNYNCGVIGGQYIYGDLNVTINNGELYRVDDDPTMPQLPPKTFPMDEDFHMMIFREDGTIVYGCNEALENGKQQDCRDPGLRSQDDR